MQKQGFRAARATDVGIAIDSAAGRWVAWIERRPGQILFAVLLLSAAAALYAARNLGVNADTRRLINEKLPFQKRERERVVTFRVISEGILVVVDADSPFAARRAADTLADRLSKRGDLFSQVYISGGGPFFARNALLYLDVEQIDELTNRLSEVQPLLGELARDRSLVGIADLLRQTLADVREKGETKISLSTVLERISDVIDATPHGRTAPDPWSSALLGNVLPEEPRRRVITLEPRLNYAELLNAEPAIRSIREAAHDLGLTAEQGVTVRITGEPVLNYEELLAVRVQTRIISVMAFLLFTGTIFLALRSVRVVLALVGSVLVSLALGNAFAALTIGNLNQISAAFNVPSAASSVFTSAAATASLL